MLLPVGLVLLVLWLCGVIGLSTFVVGVVLALIVDLVRGARNPL